ncbi:hypothetical protein ACEWY4_003904 [Coilia grayii]|uniref:Uncharacterized protein n=1 Tax=Coilia grayii TaxID=363190 RepID=A0ABD1KK18_9TELE
MNLRNNELDQLADFLGHNIAVHRQYYRLPEATVQVTKIAKLLLALEKGKLPELQGKTLDELGELADGDGCNGESTESKDTSESDGEIPEAATSETTCTQDDNGAGPSSNHISTSRNKETCVAVVLSTLPAKKTT